MSAARGPAQGLTRVAALYGMVERMRSAELRAAAAALQEAARAVGAQQAARREQMQAGKRALATGDRVEWALAESGRACAETQVERMALVKAERMALEAEADKAHRESRVQVEQVKRVVERLRVDAAVKEERRVQAAADDRYASRKNWKAMNAD